MPYIIRMGTGSIMAMVLFIPLLILITIALPVLIIVILSIAAAVVVSAVLISRVKSIGKKKESGRTKKRGDVIDAEYEIK